MKVAMDPDKGDQIEDAEEAVNAMRAEAAEQLISARELAKRVRADALNELEDTRARVARIAAREEEMAERWAQLLAAGNAARMAHAESSASPSNAPITDANEEAQQMIERAQNEATRIREDAMKLLAIAEGEKAESREIAQDETDRALFEAEKVRSDAAEEAARVRAEAQDATPAADGGRYSRSGRKLPRIGEGASSLLSEMGNLRAKSAEEENREVG